MRLPDSPGVGVPESRSGPLPPEVLRVAPFGIMDCRGIPPPLGIDALAPNPLAVGEGLTIGMDCRRWFD